MANWLIVNTAFLAVACIAVSGCAGTPVGADSIVYRVMNGAKNPPEPIAGAAVFAQSRVRYLAPGHSNDHCSGASLHFSDHEGRVSLPRGTYVSGYKTGYAAPITSAAPPIERAVVLVSNPTREELREQFRAMRSAVGECFGSTNAGPPFLDLVVRDYRIFAKTDDERAEVASMEKLIRDLKEAK